MSPEAFDVVVIGGGTAGLVTASGCARLGRRVALVEREALGGDCLWTGCVPTKALVSTARLAERMRHAEALGLEPISPLIEAQAIFAAMREAQRVTQRHDDPEKFRRLGIDVVFGEARLEPGRRVRVGARLLHAKDVVLATGSRTRPPDLPGLDGVEWVDHASFLRRGELPRSAIVLGGGAIAVELSQVLRRLGADVTMLQRGASILKREDEAIQREVARILRGEGVDLRLGATLLRASRTGGRTRVVFSEGGREASVSAEMLLVATGRRGNVEGLGLEDAGVEVRDGFIVADRYLRTTAPRVWACGDVHGRMLFTHAAAFEAAGLIRNMLFPGKSAIDYGNVPWCVFTDPEVARVGMTEAEAVETRGRENVRAWTVEMADVDRAVTERETAGFVKLVTDRRGTILGAHLLAAHASSLIGTLVLARRKGARLGELARMVSPYPSLGDALAKAGSLYYQELAGGRMGRMGRLLARWSQR